MTTTIDDIREILKELAQSQQETDRQIKSVSKQIGDLGNRLGEFVEYQVRPAVVRLFQERGIDVHEFHPGLSVTRDHVNSKGCG
jgi:hypothetical protein